MVVLVIIMGCINRPVILIKHIHSEYSDTNDDDDINIKYTDNNRILYTRVDKLNAYRVILVLNHKSVNNTLDILNIQ